MAEHSPRALPQRGSRPPKSTKENIYATRSAHSCGLPKRFIRRTSEVLKPVKRLRAPKSVGGRYLLFLTETDSESVFEILTGYELRESSVYALDDLPKSRSYETNTTTNFLNELRAKLPKP
jgi:hypothetical protein